MRILLTNDDGYDAPGLAALWRAVRGLAGVEIDIVAPAEGRSGQGHAVSSEFLCHPASIEPMGPVTVVEGTPADCVRAALHLPDRARPDWVIAGINRGGNLGMDVWYSGTVAAVREAAVLGLPSIALSQLVIPGTSDDWPAATAYAAAVVSALLRPDLPPAPPGESVVHRQTRQALAGEAWPERPCWNVNLPRSPAGDPPLGVRCVPLSTDPLAIAYIPTRRDDGWVHLRFHAAYADRKASPNTDVQALFDGYITISSLPLAL